MTNQDKPQFAAVMGGLAENFNGKLSGPGLDMRFAALSEFSIEQVNQAAIACVRSRKYSNMPTIAEIVEHIVGSKEDHKIEGEVQARKVLEAAARYGKYATVQFADPVTNAVVRQFIGGWVKACQTKQDAHLWFIKDFSARYAEYKQNGTEDFEPLRGIGTEDREQLKSLGISEKVEMIGTPTQTAIEGNYAGQAKVKSLVGGLNFKSRQAFRDGAPPHELFKAQKDGAA